jgi:hypothetical protein
MNSFGVKTTLSKADRNYLAKKTKNDLINEALSLNLMVDENLTKQQILNQIKKQRQLIGKEQKRFNMDDLFETLPTINKKNKYDFSKIRESDLLYQPEIKYHRFPPGSKIDRKVLTKTQKTQMRREIKDEIDKLSDLLRTI